MGYPPERWVWINTELTPGRPEGVSRRLRLWLAGLGSFGLVAILLGLPSLLRGPSPSPPASDLIATPTTTPMAVVRPTLPPDQELYSTMFDEKGCLKTGPALTDVDCGNRVPYNEAFDGPPETNPVRNLMGFQGQFYATEVVADSVVVLTDTVSVVPGKSWEALGLVRNETQFPGGPSDGPGVPERQGRCSAGCCRSPGPHQGPSPRRARSIPRRDRHQC